MITSRKRDANRTNARASTGPKTARGKSHSAKNAFAHGLSLPILADPALSEEVEALALEIAGPAAGANLRELARRVAEAQIDLRRVRNARLRLLSSALSDPEYRSPMTERQAKLAVQIDKLRGRLELTPHLQPIQFAGQMNLTADSLQKMTSRLLGELDQSTQPLAEGPQKFATILSACASSLWPWIVMNAERSRDANLPFAPLMQQELEQELP